jgi:hypothetical protein
MFELTYSDKRSSLLPNRTNYGRKKFYGKGPCPEIEACNKNYIFDKKINSIFLNSFANSALLESTMHPFVT